VFRNTSAMAYAIAYCIHTLEMSALRGWGVAFLGYVAATTGAAAATVFSPAIIATGLGLIGTFASVAGNEAAIRYGRKRLIVAAMLASILIGATIGFLGSMSYAVAAVLLTVYGIVIWLDSSSLTAGQPGRPSRHGGVPPSQCIPCSATQVGSLGHCWWVGSSISPAVCLKSVGDFRSSLSLS
jgi:MFS family permease